MKLRQRGNVRAVFAIVFTIAFAIFWAVSFVYQTSVALGFQSFSHISGQVMVEGFMLWLYVVYSRMEDAQNSAVRPATNMEISIDLVVVFLATVSGLGLVFPHLQEIARWVNAVAAFVMLVVSVVSGVTKIRYTFNLFKLR